MAAAFASCAVFFCLLCFSTLSTAVDLPAIDHPNHDLLPESNTKSDEADTIFLPSERLESESAPEIQSLPEISDSKIPKPDSEVETLKSTESSEASDSVPITMITFRPLNRHTPWRPMQFPSRPGHRCRHNHKFKPWNPRLPRHQIPYGNDVILSNGKEQSFDVLPDDQVPKIPMRWTRFDRFEPRFTDGPGMERSEEVMMRRHHHHHDDDHDHDHDEEHNYHRNHRDEHDHDEEHDHHRNHKDEHDHDEEHDHDDDHDHDHDEEHGHHRNHKDEHDHEHDHHHHHKHDHHHDHEHDQFYERDHEDGGLMKSIRKFLQHF